MAFVTCYLSCSHSVLTKLHECCSASGNAACSIAHYCRKSISVSRLGLKCIYCFHVTVGWYPLQSCDASGVMNHMSPFYDRLSKETPGQPGPIPGHCLPSRLASFSFWALPQSGSLSSFLGPLLKRWGAPSNLPSVSRRTRALARLTLNSDQRRARRQKTTQNIRIVVFLTLLTSVRKTQGNLSTERNVGAEVSVLAQPQGPAFKSLLGLRWRVCMLSWFWVCFFTPISFGKSAALRSPAAPLHFPHYRGWTHCHNSEDGSKTGRKVLNQAVTAG